MREKSLYTAETAQIVGAICEMLLLRATSTGNSLLPVNSRFLRKCGGILRGERKCSAIFRRGAFCRLPPQNHSRFLYILEMSTLEKFDFLERFYKKHIFLEYYLAIFSDLMAQRGLVADARGIARFSVCRALR